jgi:hypothetical protein
MKQYTPPTMTLAAAAVEVSKQAKRNDWHKIAAIAGRVAVGGGNDKERALIAQYAAKWELATVEAAQ